VIGDPRFQDWLKNYLYEAFGIADQNGSLHVPLDECIEMAWNAWKDGGSY
jgi:acyl-CoA hydrolase